MKKWMIWLLAALLFTLSGCSKKQEQVEIEHGIYYIEPEGYDLVKQPYEGSWEYGEESVKAVLKALEDPDKEVAGRSPFQKGVKVSDFKLEDRYLSLYFDSSYLKLEETDEVLLRSSLVQSLTVIEGIDAVAFHVERYPLTDKNNKPYGFMRAEDFVQNTGSAINSYQKTELTLFFANEKGDKLLKETKNIRYNSNNPMEKVIVERLIKGPSESDHYPTIAPEVKLLGVSVKEGICYVNFDEGIQAVQYDLKPEIVIYSIVNSLIENGVANQVQISINGETNVKLRGSVSLEQPFGRDFEIVEEH